MSRELQAREFDHSAYERPDQPWVCGWAADGRPCRQGPGPGGRCTVTHECSPVRREDRWQCTRPEPYGGACESGPLPGGTCCKPVARCQPARSLRAQRGRVTRWATAVSIAVLTLAISSSGGRDFVSPGPITDQHGPIEEDCGSCHSAGGDDPARWFSGAFASADGPSESRLCQKCHDLGTSGLQPHSVVPEDLARETEAAVEAGGSGHASIQLAVASLGPGPPTGDDGSVACATCHREHGGRDRDLTRLTNAQCQICHENQFASFGRGHPGFTAYPYLRRTRIDFNHGTHRKDHFPQKGEDFTCRGCHEPDRQGQVMLVSGFEENCSSCHEKDVLVDEGVAFLQLPGIDTDALSDNGVGIGEWPLLADIDQDSSFGAYLRILLSADPAAVAALEQLPGNPDELVLPEFGVDPDEAQAVGQIVWATKELLYKLSTQRQEGLQEYLDRGLGAEMSETDLAVLSANIDFGLVAEATRSWFPNLPREIIAQRSARESGDTGYDLARFPTRIVESSSPSAMEPMWGWSVDPDSVSIRFQPRGHSDPFMRRWLDEAVKAEGDDYALAALGTSESDGHCAKCHSVDITPDKRVVNWHQKRRDLLESGFTRFLHRPHLIQPRLRECVACHALEGTAPVVEAEPASEEGEVAVAEPEEAVTQEEVDAEVSEASEAPSVNRIEAYSEGFADRDPTTFTSNFEPLSQSTCRSCHQAGAASDSCLNCHQYHVQPAILQGVQANGAVDEDLDVEELEPQGDEAS